MVIHLFKLIRHQLYLVDNVYGDSPKLQVAKAHKLVTLSLQETHNEGLLVKEHILHHSKIRATIITTFEKPIFYMHIDQ